MTVFHVFRSKYVYLFIHEFRKMFHVGKREQIEETRYKSTRHTLDSYALHTSYRALQVVD